MTGYERRLPLMRGELFLALRLALNLWTSGGSAHMMRAQEGPWEGAFLNLSALGSRTIHPRRI
jgi:hypothetical protein